MFHIIRPKWFFFYSTELQKNPVEGFSAGLQDDNIFKWEVMIVGPPDTLYEGGFFNASLEFPHDYPDMPPVMRFTTEIWHPNGTLLQNILAIHVNITNSCTVYNDGRVCISILHPPGDDEWGYEKANERWSPVQSVETILISVISMLSDPNDESPANLEAAVRTLPNLYPPFVLLPADLGSFLITLFFVLF